MASSPRYTIVIPAFNEEASLERTVLQIAKLFERSSNIEILVVDNMSTDATADVARKLAVQLEFLTVVHARAGQGYGVAVKAGIQHATGTHVVFVMADGSEAPEDVLKFIETSGKNPQACIFGSRFGPGSQVRNYPRLKLLANRIGNAIASLSVGSKNSDLTNGFKLFPRDLLLSLAPKRDDFSITLELSLGAVLSGSQIITLPNSWKERDSGESSFRLSYLFWPYFSLILVAMTRRWHGVRALVDFMKPKPSPSQRN